MVTLNFLANGGDGYPFPLPAAGRVDLAGEAVQPNAPSPDFPDTNADGVTDGPAATEAGLAGFAAPGTEQDALAEYLARPFAEMPFDVAEGRRSRIGASRTSACRVRGTRCSTRLGMSEAVARGPRRHHASGSHTICPARSQIPAAPGHTCEVHDDADPHRPRRPRHR